MAKIGKMISTKEAEEIIRAVEAADDGVWFPIATVVFSFGIIIFLIVKMYVTSQKANEKRHTATEEIIKELADSKHTNDLILQRLEIIVESHDDKIKQLES